MKIFKRIKCWLGRHDYRLLPDLSISLIARYECGRCGNFTRETKVHHGVIN